MRGESQGWRSRGSKATAGVVFANAALLAWLGSSKHCSETSLARWGEWPGWTSRGSLHGDKDHPDIAATLHELGVVSFQAGDLKGAEQQQEECL